MSLLESLVRPTREPAPSRPNGADPAGAQEAAPAASLDLTRDFDARRVNPIINHPDVHPWIAQAGDGVLDLSAMVADFRNVLLMTDEGGQIFVQLEPGTYELHTQFLPSLRGARATEFFRLAFHYMFTRTDACSLVTKVPAHNRGAIGIARAVHLHHEFDRPDQWRTAEGLVSVGYYALRYWDWLWRASDLIERGQWFHARLDAGKRRLGIAAESHPEDAAHDRVVGAAMEQIFAGQTAKALILYNHWARFAGYAPVTNVVSENPLIIDIHDCLLAFGRDDFEVIACR